MNFHIFSRIIRPWRAVVLVVTALYLAFVGSPGLVDRHVVHAANLLTVTTLSDDAAGGTCGTTCTLRDALATAVDGDTIDLTTVSGTITLLAGNGLTISAGVTINGPGASNLVVDGRYLSNAVFTVSSGVTTSINGLAIQNGSNGGNGGGINNSGTLTVDSCTLDSNSAKVGGGIYNFNGAILTVSNSTISNNSASGFGGGGLYSGVGASLLISNSTLYNNSVSGSAYGGGIYNDGSATISNSTLTGNSAGAFGGKGGGIYNDIGTLSLFSSIIVKNMASSGPDLNKGTGISNALGYNIIGGPISLNSQMPTDQFGTDPNLGLLADNGGYTKTLAITSSSVAYGHGNCNANNGTLSTNPPILVVTTDQRGSSYNRKTPCDAGAFEVQPIPMATHFSVNSFPLPVVVGTAATVTVTALDDSSNVVANYSGTVAISSSDGSAILPANATLTNGVGTFNLTFNTAGTQSITATDTNTSSINGTQNGIAVNNVATASATTAATAPATTAATVPATTAATAPATTAATVPATTAATAPATTAATAPATTAATAPATTAATAPATIAATAPATTAATAPATTAATAPATTAATAPATTAATAPATTAATAPATIAATVAATVAATSDPVSKQNSAANQPSDSVNPVIETAFDPALVLPGEAVTLVIRITNNNATTAQNVILIDPLPGQLDLIAVATSQGTYTISDQSASIMPVRYSRGAYLANNKTVKVYMGDLQPGHQASVTIQARVNVSVRPPLTMVDTVSLASNNFTARTISDVLRVTAGVLPGTGEVPDNSPFKAFPR